MAGFHRGEEIHGPNGQGYRVTREIAAPFVPQAGMFEPFGGAPEPRPGEVMPNWLVRAIMKKVGS